MLKDIVCRENLLQQIKLYKNKKFKPGYDGMTMDGASSWIFINGDRLQKDILRGDYIPMPAIGFRTAKMHGGYRQLSKLSAIDTVLQNAIKDAVCPVFEGIFSENSFAYRQGRGVPHAIARYLLLANQNKFVAKMDFISCFDNIDHLVLKESLERYLDDKALCDFIMLFVSMPVVVDDEIVERDRGILQGMPIAPMLCNLYFHSADEFLESSGIPFIRYADDVVIFGNTVDEINKNYKAAVDYFENFLKLTCNKKKTAVSSPVKISFLGHKFISDKKGTIAVAADGDLRAAYYDWHSRHPRDNRNRVDILSDGILRQRDFSLMFDTEAADTVIPVADTSVINIYSDVIFDAGFLETTLKNGLTVNIFDKTGDLLGSFTPNTCLRDSKVTYEQLTAYYAPQQRLALAREFLLASIHHSILNIRYYHKHENREEYALALRKIEKLKNAVKNAKNYEALLPLEAQVRKIYYGCFDYFIKNDEYEFDHRTRRPPENKINALISFGNTVLYNLIATEIQKTPLDVRIGFLHATNTRLKSLNLDIAEIFKPLLVDRNIFTMINRGVILRSHFTTCENGAVYLTMEGKKMFLQNFYEKLNVVIAIKDQKLSYNSIVIEEIRKLIRHFKGGETYRAYRQVR